MDNINNSNNPNNKQSSSVPPRNLPKKLPPELLKTRQNSQNFAKPQNVSTPYQQTQPNNKSINDILAGDQPKVTKKEPVDNIVHQSDKQILHNYNKAVKFYRKTVKSFKRKVAKSGLRLTPVKDVFSGNIPEMLWFFPRRKINGILNKLDNAISYSVSKNRSVFKAIIITILIMAIIATSVYFALILTRNLSSADTDTVGEINLNFEDMDSETKGGNTRLSINDARLNQDLIAHPTIFNNTNVSLYLRFYIKLDYVRGKDYLNVNIKDLSIKANLDDDYWWYDESDGMAYYLYKLSPDEHMALFNSFQINGHPSLETAWQNKSLTATIYAEVCQVLDENQEFPPSWSMYWAGLVNPEGE